MENQKLQLISWVFYLIMKQLKTSLWHLYKTHESNKQYIMIVRMKMPSLLNYEIGLFRLFHRTRYIKVDKVFITP